MSLTATRLYSVGNHVIGDIKNVPASRSGARVTLTREAWPDGDVAELTIIGTAGTQTWVIGPFGLAGGVSIGRDGLPALTSAMSWSWPGENDGQGRRREIKITNVKVELRVLQQINTSINVELF